MDSDHNKFSDNAINFTAIIAVKSLGVAGAIRNSIAAGSSAAGQILDKALTKLGQERYTNLKTYLKSEEGKRRSLSLAGTGAWAVEETFTFMSGLQDGNYYRMGGAILWGVLLGMSLKPENEKKDVPVGNNAFEQWKDALAHPNSKRPYFRIAFRCFTAALSAAGGIHYGITEGRYEYMFGSVIAAATFATEFKTMFNDSKRVEFSEVGKVEAVGIAIDTKKGVLATIRSESAKALISLTSSIEANEVRNLLSKSGTFIKSALYSTTPTSYALYKTSCAINKTKTLLSKAINEYGHEVGLIKGSGGSATLVSEGIRFDNENTVYTGVSLLLARGMEYLNNKTTTGKKHIPNAEGQMER